MRKLSSIFLILLFYLGCTLVLNAQYSFEVQLTQVIRESGKLDVDVEIRSTGTSSFVLASSTFAFNYNTAGLGSPTKVEANDGPWDVNTDLDYLNVYLSSGSGYAALSVTFWGWVDNNGTVVPSTFTRIGTVQFTILNSSQSSGLVWRSIGSVTAVYRLTTPGAYPGTDPRSHTFVTGTFLETSDVPLPIQMAFSAASVVRNNDVEISWKTVSETNNYGFEIYRKRGDAGKWTKIGFVQGHGTTLAPQSYTYDDAGLSFGKYTYQIRQVDLDGKSSAYGGPEMSVTVGVAPDKMVLAQNYPNPFNPSTVIEFVVPQNGFATVTVYNVLGQEVATLFEGNAEAGKIYTTQFNASNLPSAMYFYTLKSAGKTETKRMLLMK
jgi:hypothetical protein